MTDTMSKVCFVMPDGTEILSDHWVCMTDAIFAKIVSAARGAGRPVPVRWCYREIAVALTAQDVEQRAYYEGRERVERALHL